MFAAIQTLLGAAVLPSSCVEQPPLTERLITLRIRGADLRPDLVVLS